VYTGRKQRTDRQSPLQANAAEKSQNYSARLIQDRQDSLKSSRESGIGLSSCSPATQLVFAAHLCPMMTLVSRCSWAAPPSLKDWHSVHSQLASGQGVSSIFKHAGRQRRVKINQSTRRQDSTSRFQHQKHRLATSHKRTTHSRTKIRTYSGHATQRQLPREDA
jgi:hypothetical protein